MTRLRAVRGDVQACVLGIWLAKTPLDAATGGEVGQGVEGGLEVSRITDQVLEEVKAWQSRPLDPCYPVVFLDAIVVKVRDNHTVQAKPTYSRMLCDIG